MPFARNVVACCLTIALGTLGCSRTTGLRFSSMSSGQRYAQPFSRAFFNHTEQGDYDIVLLDDGLKSSASSSTGPLQPVAATSLNQFVHIHILWKPVHGTRTDAPSSTNSIIDWYVRTNEFIDEPDRLHYRGPGWVSVYDGKEVARFVIRDARLSLVDSSGNLHDPLGPTMLSGSFKAANSRATVTALMDAEKRDLAAAPAAAAPAEMTGPPGRSQSP